MIINCINLPHRWQRKQSAMGEFEKVGAAYMIWPGVEGGLPKTNISQAFKNIVRFAKNHGLERITIAEDDIHFVHPKAYDYYLNNLPEDADLYLGSYYSGEEDENHVINNFRGMTLVTVFNLFYDTFLSVTENRHIDAALSETGGRFVVCPKFVAVQHPGYSDQRKKMVDDSHRLKGKILYDGN